MRLVPPFEDVEEGVLHQLLGLVGVPDDQVEGTVEPFVLVREESPSKVSGTAVAVAF